MRFKIIKTAAILYKIQKYPYVCHMPPQQPIKFHVNTSTWCGRLRSPSAVREYIPWAIPSPLACKGLIEDLRYIQYIYLLFTSVPKCISCLSLEIKFCFIELIGWGGHCHINDNVSMNCLCHINKMFWRQRWQQNNKQWQDNNISNCNVFLRCKIVISSPLYFF